MLEKLTEVRFIGYNYQEVLVRSNNLGFGHLKFFASVSSIRSLYATHLDRDRHAFNSKPAGWNLTSLELRRSVVDNIELRRFLNGVRALVRFVYHRAGSEEIYYRHGANCFIYALRDHVGSRLIHLQLSKYFEGLNRSKQ